MREFLRAERAAGRARETLRRGVVEVWPDASHAINGEFPGRIADRAGRVLITQVALAGICLTTLLIALVPGHEVLGAGTFLAVLALRLLGGIFLGGEYTSAIPLAMEWSPPRRRGLVSGLIMSMAPWAQSTIAFATAALLALLGPATYAEWGWRLSFVAGGLVIGRAAAVSLCGSLDVASGSART